MFGAAAAARRAALPVLLLLITVASPRDVGQVTAGPFQARIVAASAIPPQSVTPTPIPVVDTPTPNPSPSPSEPPPPPRPARLLIPTLNLDTAIEEVGYDGNGAMATPRNLWNVGWFSPGPLPGAPGDAVIDGHLGLPGSPLIFGSLARLRAGDLVTVLGADGKRRNFEVKSAAMWPSTSQPPGVFARGGPPRLTLITCGGEYLKGTRTYADRLIVEAAYAGTVG